MNFTSGSIYTNKVWEHYLLYTILHCYFLTTHKSFWTFTSSLNNKCFLMEKTDLRDDRNEKLLLQKKKRHHTYETKYGMNQMKKAWEEYNLSKRPGGESLEHYEGCLEEALSWLSGLALCNGQGGTSYSDGRCEGCSGCWPRSPREVACRSSEFSLPTWSDDEK